MFNRLPLAERVFTEAEVPPAARGFARDTVTLGWEERIRTRGRRRSDGGVEFGTALPRGTVLRGGDWLVLEQARLLIAIVERDEPVFVVEPRSPAEFGLFAYHIGNRHQPIMITDGALICPDLPGVEEMLRYHDIAYARATRPFTPVSGLAAHQH
jgi:urease accessory protein